MTSCSVSPPPVRRWHDERANPGSRTCQRETVLQGAADTGDRSALRATGGTGHQVTAQSYRLSGSATDDGVGGTGPARHSTTDSGCQAAAAEDAGRVRL